MIIPEFKRGGKRAYVKRSPRSLVKLALEYYMLMEKLLREGCEALKKTLEDRSYREALDKLRVLQWMGLIDLVDENKPYTEGLDNILVRESIITTFAREKLGFLNLRERVCVALTTPFITPTPARTIMHYSTSSRSYVELGEKLLQKGYTLAEKIIGAHTVAVNPCYSDAHGVIDASCSMAFTRYGKKSDPGRYIVYFRSLKRGVEWSMHPCIKYSPSNGIALLEVEKKIYNTPVAPVTNLEYNQIVKGGVSVESLGVFSEPEVYRVFKEYIPVLFRDCIEYFNFSRRSWS